MIFIKPLKKCFSILSRQHLNSEICILLGFCHKMFSEITPMGYWTSLNLNVIVLIVSFNQNMNFKIQMLAGKDTKPFFERFYKNHRTLTNRKPPQSTFAIWNKGNGSPKCTCIPVKNLLWLCGKIFKKSRHKDWDTFK